MLVCKAMCFLHCANRTLAAAHLDLAAKGRCLRAASGVPVLLRAVTGRGQRAWQTLW